MNVEQVHAAARALGIAPAALDAMTTRAREHFGDGQVKPADLTAFLTALPVWDKIGMTQQEFYAMPPTWRSSQGWSFAPPPVQRRPVTRALTTEELATLKSEGLTGGAYVEKARQMQQTPAPPPQP